jgi:hypothetical protein
LANCRAIMSFAHGECQLAISSAIMMGKHHYDFFGIFCIYRCYRILCSLGVESTPFDSHKLCHNTNTSEAWWWCCCCCCCHRWQVSKFIYHQAPIHDSLCRGGPTLRHTVVYLAQLEHHFRYSFPSHLRQIEQTFTHDLDIKKRTLHKYSNFRREVGNASVGDPSIIRARQWETSK